MCSVIADEARDGSTEQLAVCVQYVSEGRVKECLMAVTELKQFDAEYITAAAAEQLAPDGTEHVRCVAQTYGGAAVQSGTAGGDQARFKAASHLSDSTRGPTLVWSVRKCLLIFQFVTCEPS